MCKPFRDYSFGRKWRKMRSARAHFLVDFVLFCCTLIVSTEKKKLGCTSTVCADTPDDEHYVTRTVCGLLWFRNSPCGVMFDIRRVHRCLRANFCVCADSARAFQSILLWKMRLVRLVLKSLTHALYAHRPHGHKNWAGLCTDIYRPWDGAEHRKWSIPWP